MTQTQLADLLDVQPQQIQNYVKGNKPRIMSLVVAKNISAILGCTIEDLYEWKNVE